MGFATQRRPPAPPAGPLAQTNREEPLIMSTEMSSKKLVIDARESGTTTGRYIDNLIKYLHILLTEAAIPDNGEDKFEVTLLAKPHRQEFLASIAPTFTVVATTHKEFTFAEQIGFKKQIEALHPDIVHFPAVQQPVWLSLGQGGKVVTTMQDLTTLRFRNPAKNPIVFTIKQWVYRWVNHRVAHKSDLLITPSEFVKQDVAAFSGISPDKITVTYEAADELPTPAEPVAALEGKQFIMYVGRPTPHKNLERLIEAFAELQKTHSNLHLALVGKKDTNYEQIAATAANRGVKQIVFTDFVSDQQLRWLFENCQVYVFPSLSEGFGLPALEAMQHGAPVASSNATCLPEIYGDGAQYFDPLSVDNIVAKVGEVLDNHDLRDILITNGKRKAATYSWRRMAEQTLEVYRKALTS